MDSIMQMLWEEIRKYTVYFELDDRGIDPEECTFGEPYYNEKEQIVSELCYTPKGTIIIPIAKKDVIDSFKALFKTTPTKAKGK